MNMNVGIMDIMGSFFTGNEASIVGDAVLVQKGEVISLEPEQKYCLFSIPFTNFSAS